MDARRTHLLNIKFITCSKAEVHSPSQENLDNLVFLTPRRTYLPSINALASSKAKI